jgi:5,10-methylenetetrahydromethanopterin reductase
LLAAGLAGFSAVFVAEGHGDALALCHPVAAATRQARVGTAIANAALRPPVLAAKTAAQLDQASNGRFILSLGVANSVMNERFGIAPFAPLAMIEEYAAVVRAVLTGSPAGYDGQVFRTGMVPHGLAAAAARAAVLRYVMHPAAPRLFGELDGGPSLRGVRELVLAGDRTAAADAVPQQVADGFVVHGGADDCLARASEYAAASVDLPVLFPMPADGDWGYEKTIAAMAGKIT